MPKGTRTKAGRTPGVRAAEERARRARQPVPVPWGLLIALGVYAGLVAGYVNHRFWSAPEYQAAEHFGEAWRILGADGGRGVPREELIEAYEHLLEAARLLPEVKDLHDYLERLNWRFEERGLKQPEELRKRAEAVAMTWRKIQDGREPILVVGVRDRGWAPDQLLEGPGQVVKWSLIGVVLIVLVWGYGRWNQHAAKKASVP